MKSSAHRFNKLVWLGRCAAAAAAALLIAAPIAQADEEADSGSPAVEISGNVGLFSDYVWRGMTQTMHHPAIQGGLDLGYSVFYAGFWGSNVDFGPEDNSSLELDLYGGISSDLAFLSESLDFLSIDVGYVAYRYPGENADNFEEVYFGPTVSYGPVSLSYTQSLGIGSATDNMDVEASGEVLGGTLAAGYGDYDSYGKHFRAGVSYPIAGLDWGLTYIDFNGDADLANEESWVWSVSKSL